MLVPTPTVSTQCQQC